MKTPAVYIMANKKDGILYIGVTSNLIKRIYEHKNGITGGFTSKYKCKMLVFYELHDTMESAITRETVLKKGPRKRKLLLINQMNPTWKDLYLNII